MANFLIEIHHADNKIDCMKVMQVFVESGSHFLAKADWGCADLERKAWMVVDVDRKEQALQIVPPLYRQKAKIIKLFKMSREEVDHYKNEHMLNETDEYHS